MSFKENLINELYYQDIQIKEFAGKINIPYNTLLSYVDSRSRLPKIDVAYKMAQELNVSIDYLITGKNEDRIKKSVSESFKELTTLPSNVVNLVQSLIHNYYELYKFNQLR